MPGSATGNGRSAAAAFEQRARPNHSADQERIAYLEKKIRTKDEFWRSSWLSMSP